jgi:hypothetical protein
LSAVVVFSGRTHSDIGAVGNQLALHVERATDALGKHVTDTAARLSALLPDPFAIHQPYLPFARRFDCS